MKSDNEFPEPPNPGAEWMNRIIANPDVESTKMLFIVGVLNSFDPSRRQRILRYINERFEFET